MELMNITKMKQCMVSLKPVSTEQEKQRMTDFLETEFPSRLCFAVLTDTYCWAARTRVFQWHIVEATAIRKEKVERSYEKNHHEIEIFFEPGEVYTVGPLVIRMKRESKGSKSFFIDSIEPLSIKKTGTENSIGEVMRSHNITDYPVDHPIFAAIKAYNDPIERYNNHIEIAMQARSEFNLKMKTLVDGISNAFELESNKRQKMD